MDPLEWLARLSDHGPDPGKRRTRFYGHYANRVRGRRSTERVGLDGRAERAEAGRKPRCPPSWARLIAKVYQADPLVCRRCGGPLKIVAYVTGELSMTMAAVRRLATAAADAETPARAGS